MNGITTVNDTEWKELTALANRLGARITWPESWNDPETGVNRTLGIFLPATKSQMQAGREGDNGIFRTVAEGLDFLQTWEKLQQLKHDVTNKDVKAYVRRKLSTSDEWAKKALLLIMSHQLPEEQRSDRTVFVNGKGFSGYDAPILTSLAKQLRDRQWLSIKQMALLKKTIVKYWQQVVDASDEVKLLTQVKAAQPVQQTRLPL